MEEDYICGDCNKKSKLIDIQQDLLRMMLEELRWKYEEG